MAATEIATDQIVVDLIEGATMKEENGFVIEATRKAMVSGMHTQFSDGVLIRALQLTGIVVPLQHPFFPNLTISSRIPRALGPNSAVVTITYTVDDAGNPGGETVVSGSASLDSIQTELTPTQGGGNGSQITVSHNEIVQGGSISVLRPRREVNFERPEEIQLPGSIADLYVGKLNESAWNAGAARTWLCTEIKFDLVDGDGAIPVFRLQYQFRYNSEKWDPTVIFIDPETGKPPPALVAGTGYKTILAYDAVDFTALGLF